MDGPDLDLWRLFTATVRPLPGRAQTPQRPAVRHDVVAPMREAAVAVRARQLPAIAVGVPPAGLDRASWRRLRRGHVTPERRLDLHGYRMDAAYAAFEGFITECSVVGLRIVEVVTGRGSGANGGVIRRALPDWLNRPTLRPLLLAACYTSRDNAGAVFLLLRRHR